MTTELAKRKDFLLDNDERLENITGKQAGEEAKAREAAFFASRRACRCKQPIIVRVYMGAGYCQLCGHPRYAA